MLLWKDLTSLSNEHLGAVDVAEVNLACATDLPGAPDAAQAAERIDRLNHYAKGASRNDFQGFAYNVLRAVGRGVMEDGSWQTSRFIGVRVPAA